MQATSAGSLATAAKAGFWIRFAAIIIDSILLGIVQAAIAAILNLTTGGRSGLSVLLGLIYYVYFWSNSSLWPGQTVGDKLLNIRVIKTDGSDLELGSGAPICRLVHLGPRDLHRRDLGGIRPEQAGLARQDRGDLRRQDDLSACSKSATRSSGCSRPTEQRISPSLIPTAARSSAVRPRCEVEAGWLSVVATWPRLGIRRTVASFATIASSADLPPASSNERSAPAPQCSR